MDKKEFRVLIKHCFLMAENTVDYQRWYNVGKQWAKPYSDSGKSNFLTVDIQGLPSV